MSDRVRFICNGDAVDVAVVPGESLLSVLRERLGVVSVKDGCAPQGQCGCCTVLIDGDPRVACVTAASRIDGRAVTTVEGLDPEMRERLVGAISDVGASQCGFCTPGIIVRAASLLSKQRTSSVEIDRALTAHLCRCTGWRTVQDAIALAAHSQAAPPVAPPTTTRDLDAAGVRAQLEGGVAQQVGSSVPLGAVGFADDDAPRDALVAVPLPPGSSAAAVEAAGWRWVIGESVEEARTLAAKVQGRRTTIEERPPLPLRSVPAGGVRLATSWVEPAYLEPDASWCAPGGEPASPLANGGAFGGKAASPVGAAARELADLFQRPVRMLFAREDVVRMGAKRPPISATAVLRDGTVEIDGTLIGDPDWVDSEYPLPYAIDCNEVWTGTAAPGPATAPGLRAFPLVERSVLVEGAISERGIDRSTLVRDDRVGAALINVCVIEPAGALAGARVLVDPDSGTITRVEVRVGAGDPLDETVLRSYCIGAAHMALGWVLHEGLAVDADTGAVLDLTIRSFGVLRAKDTPEIDVTILDEPGPALPRASDAVMAAVAAATWNAVTAADGQRPDSFPARSCRAARPFRL